MLRQVTNEFVYVVEVHNNKTLEHEVICYLTELSDERREALTRMFNDAQTDDEDFSLRFYMFNSDFDNVTIIMEALNFARE